MNLDPRQEEKIKEEMKMLLERGFFNIQSGQIIINKNNGMIQDIKFTKTLYIRGKGLDTQP